MNKEQKGTGFWAVVQSILAAGLGVQSKANRERDFTHGKPIHFIVGGLMGTVVLIVVIVIFVQYVIHSAS